MKIGYLHLGLPEHGINRYGRLLAEESKKRSDLIVLEAEVILADNSSHNCQMFSKAGRYLSQTDLVHIQFSSFNDQLWGQGWSQLTYLKVFLSHCSCPIIVTLHDVYYMPAGFQEILTYLLSLFRSKVKTFEAHPETSIAATLRKVIRTTKELWINTFGAATVTLKELTQHAHLVLVCSQEEANRLKGRVDPRKLKIVPHFVEPRLTPITPVKARRSLCLDEHKVITVLGFVFPSKGHQLVVEAIPYLPPDVQVIFAGSGDAAKELVSSLLELAEEKGVGHRLRLTGYLSETELEKYLMATDLAICAFKNFSASGSISTWISVNCPILASDLPQIREYNKLEVDAIQVFKPYTPRVLAAAIKRLLEEDQEAQKIKVASLAQKLSLSNIFDQHFILYQTVSHLSAASCIFQV